MLWAMARVMVSERQIMLERATGDIIILKWEREKSLKGRQAKFMI